MSKEKKDFEETRENEFKDIPEEVCSPFFPKRMYTCRGSNKWRWGKSS